ncbi:MAG: multiheme c-type cytochrome [Candidatus Zixiibacteriota bacterium]
MMRKLVVIALLGFALLAFAAMLAVAQEETKTEAKTEAKEGAKAEFVGAEKCAKVCHKVQFNSWLETGHAKAFTVLTDEDKAKPECVTPCHVTGKLADGTLLEGVQCEACHGAGSEYKSPKIMSKPKWSGDPAGYKKMAMDAGLIYPTAEHCTQCHKEEGNPNFKPFDFEASKGKVHAFEE